MTLRPLVVLIFFCLLCSSALSRQDYGSTLPLKRIFSKPYLSGSRPTDPKLSPDGKLLLFRWDSTAQDKYRYWMQVLNRSTSGEALNKIDSGQALNGSAPWLIRDTLLGEIEWAPDGKTIA